ncbi:MAG: hypothetical protein HC886_21900 [Leptolyngbyaceae cyanobacterium SM1_1_3]|nr:hypothetical protein [Leptolyngbyaceae cyanobacterium SM1_1_3]NJN01503.1 hypothetical protein [Leptolyngbyaceae cyanobacterium RM1_1_2]NJO08687.1 hypothetical protein [Leptolyngbyaceae cyanobacterium SL_1_1]
MTSQKSPRKFNGRGYRQVQRSNSERRSQLPKADQTWLKQKGYKNVGWDSVVKLYQKIEQLLAHIADDEPTLEDLFLQADRIGKRYQSDEEIQAFDQQLAQEVNAISEIVDRQFPEEDSESVDYRRGAAVRVRKNVRLKKHS